MSKRKPFRQGVLFCPAKVNLMLAVTGRHKNSLHELLSIMAPVGFGDYLWVKMRKATDEDTLLCSQNDLDTGQDNLVLRAARLFRQVVDISYTLHFYLQKNIPVGAGLGGGSSDGVGALHLLNALMGRPLSYKKLSSLAFQLGSDCPFFIEPKPALMSGCGEKIEAFSGRWAKSITGRRILLFKPHFSISTPWAYSRLQPIHWQGADAAKVHLKNWKKDPNHLEALLINDLQAPVFNKYPALPLLLEDLHKDFGLACQMTGSGSACFALLDDQMPIDAIRSMIQKAWGEHTWMVETVFC